MILVTGGAGYIGSHACVALLTAGEQVVVFDNFSNSSLLALERVRQITGKSVAVIEGDIRDQIAIEKVLAQYRIKAVMHFAGLKSVQDFCCPSARILRPERCRIAPAASRHAEYRC